MLIIEKIKIFINIVLCLIIGGNFFPGTLNLMRAGDIDMIKNDHTKAFATEYTELVPYAREHEDTISWFDGMVSGNGENGVTVAGSPYSDSYIYNNIHFLMPSQDPRYTPEEVTGQLHDARQNVINGNAAWDCDGRQSTYFYAYHPSHVLRTESTKLPYYDYIRWTDYETAELGVKYTDILGRWERVTFSSREDNVTITKITKSSLGAKIDMTISLQDCWSLRGFGAGNEKDMRYKKLVDDEATYISLIAHYPSYEGSELKDGGWCGFTKVDLEWNSEEVKITVTSDAAQTIKLSVYGGDVQTVAFAQGETKTVTFER